MKSIFRNIISFILKLLDAVQVICTFLNNRREDKKDKEKEENFKKVEDVVDKGSLQDLLNITKTSIILIFFMFCGCISENTINITTTKEWEGHYMKVDDFKTKTQNINLEKNESIWVISNTTLKNILENYKNK